MWKRKWIKDMLNSGNPAGNLLFILSLVLLFFFPSRPLSCPSGICSASASSSEDSSLAISPEPPASFQEEPEVKIIVEVQALPDRDKEYLNAADELLDQSSKRTFKSEHYTVIADHPEPQAAAAVANYFELFRKLYISIFEKSFTLRKVPYETHIILFKSEMAYKYFCQKVGGPHTEQSAGHYVTGTSIIASHFMQENRRGLIEVLIHEGVHQMNDQLLYSKDVAHSAWVEEGLATYFAFTKLDREGAFRVGKIEATFYKAEAYLRELKQAMRRKKHLPLQDLVAIGDKNVFYGKEVHLHYAESWLFIHFLLHHQGGKYRKPFTEYMMYEIEGLGGLESFKKVFGNDLSALEKEFISYILKLY